MSTTTKYRHCERRRREAIQCGAGKCMESLYLCRYDSLDRHGPAGFAKTEILCATVAIPACCFGTANTYARHDHLVCIYQYL